MEINSTQRFRIAFALMLLASLLGCDSDRSQIRQISKENEALLLISQKNEKGPEIDSELEQFALGITGDKEEEASLICFVDTSCSVCIGDFLQLVRTLIKIPNLHIIAVVDGRTDKTFLFYAEKILKEDASRFELYPINQPHPFDLLLGRIRTLLVCDGQVKEAFTYSEGKMSHTKRW